MKLTELFSFTLIMLSVVFLGYLVINDYTVLTIAESSAEINLQNQQKKNDRVNLTKEDLRLARLEVSKEVLQKEVSFQDQYNLYFDRDFDLLSFLEKMRFKFQNSNNLGEHLDSVYAYLSDNYDENKASFIFKIYSQFVKCDEELLLKLQFIPTAYDKDDIFEKLDYVESFRKNYLGAELYDVLYQDSISEKKYIFEKSSILGDDSLYASQKQDLLKELESKYGYEPQKRTNYEQYREALLLNKKDLKDLTSLERENAIKDLRNQYFSKEVLERRAILFQKDFQYAEKVEQYETEKAQVLTEENLSDKEKEKALLDLASSVFSDNEFKRYERVINMAAERNKLLNKYGLSSK